MIASPVCEEFIDFLAAGTTPDSLVAFRPSEAAKQRVEELIRREKTASLSAEEADELTHCMQLEHIRRVKASVYHQENDTLPISIDILP